MTLKTQADIEDQMYYGGVKRAMESMKRNEDAGGAVNNPYASGLLREYVIPLSDTIREEMGRVALGTPGPRATHVNLLRALNPDAVAYLTVRTTLNTLLTDTRDSGMTAVHLATKVGKSVHSELVLEQVAENAPDLFHALTKDLDRRRSKDERHRTTVFKMQAAKNNIEVIEWPLGARQQVGMYLLGVLSVLGLIEIQRDPTTYGKTQSMVAINFDVAEKLDKIKHYLAITMPTYGPCVEAPRDWVTPGDGGFHTKNLVRNHPTLVRGSSFARAANSGSMPTVLAAANALQRTAWKVNNRILDIVRQVGKFKNEGEIVSLLNIQAPHKPSFLSDKADVSAMSDAEQIEFKTWKRAMSTYYTERKLTATKYARFYSATRAAEMFAEYPSIHFVYFADFRGRLYPMTYGLNPQGSDLQKALLTFAHGKPLRNEDSVKWFMVHGANKWGFDKAPLKERVQWVKDRTQQIMNMADDPVNNTEWLQADKPLQFLAWALEFREWQLYPASFVSRIPISMDGSCNGLQNLSALLRDEIGGAATNLLPSTKMQDIYQTVADAATTILSSSTYDDPDKQRLCSLWLQHGVNRSVVKRSVMTTPYGVTRSSATDYVVSDYLKPGKCPLFEPAEYHKAAVVLMEAAWPAIGLVVVKGREAMDWLRRSARVIVKAQPGLEVIQWVAPSGFVATQSYNELEVRRVRTRLHGNQNIRIYTEKDEADPHRHALGLAPNFVHSMDAAHLHLTTAAAASRGIDALAMIHDDFGTHAADAQALYEIIRQEFVQMYETNDPITEFAAAYPVVPSPPRKGALDIRGVLESTYFFS